MRSNAVPVKRLGTADDIANCAMFLASDASSYISGENITVDGGILDSVLMQIPRA
jgi:3-oxoacyl-[acyl-carrier protein] reductase